MKKLAIGCGVVVLVFGVVAVGVVYYGYTKVRSTVSQFSELGKVHDIEQQVRVKTPFAAPSSGEMTAAQVDRFMAVQAKIKQRLGTDMAAFEKNYKALADKKEATVTDLPALMSAYKDIAAGWMNAKRAQVDALNDVGMSLDEYRWVRNSSYRALGIPYVDLDFSKLADEIKSGAKEIQQPGRLAGAFEGTGPASNLKLVEKFRKQLEDNMPLAAFGL